MVAEAWLEKLERGAPEAAWDLFIERYRRLIFATIRHYATDYDDVMDVFAWVCEALRENDLARLRRYADQTSRRVRFSTWLVAVVRNLTVDWFRHQNGRRRLSTLVADLPPIQQEIYTHVFHEARSHVEAYELICSRDGLQMSFGEFLTELTETYRVLTDGRKGTLMRELGGGSPLTDWDLTTEMVVGSADSAEHVARALEQLKPDDRLAVQLFVVDELPAAEVARIIGWPSDKTVYNRVSRALVAMRESLARRGIGPGDL